MCFLLVSIFFILWMAERSGRKKDGQASLQSYSQGYRDGFRAFGASPSSKDGAQLRKRLRQLIAEGKGEASSGEAAPVGPETAPAVTQE